MKIYVLYSWKANRFLNMSKTVWALEDSPLLASMFPSSEEALKALGSEARHYDALMYDVHAWELKYEK